ncbi:MAG: hypothetical protein ACREYF_15850 [Gammaproteobacteria bacterium]
MRRALIFGALFLLATCMASGGPGVVLWAAMDVDKKMLLLGYC